MKRRRDLTIAAAAAGRRWSDGSCENKRFYSILVFSTVFDSVFYFLCVLLSLLCVLFIINDHCLLTVINADQY